MKIPIKLPNGQQDSVYMDGTLYELLMGFKKAVLNKKTSIVMITDGKSGLGKSTLSNQIGAVLDENFSINKILFSPETFLDSLSNSRKGDFYSFDEAMILNNRATTSILNRTIIQAMSMIRSKQLFICFNINSVFDLDKNLAISRADLLLHVYGANIVDRGNFCAFFKSLDGEDRLKKLYLMGKKFYDYSRPRANFVGSFTEKFIVDEIEYEARKQKAINEFLKGNESPKTKVLESRDKYILHLHNKYEVKPQELADIGGLSLKTIYNVFEKHRIHTEEHGKIG